jgi:hypothetical protein
MKCFGKIFKHKKDELTMGNKRETSKCVVNCTEINTIDLDISKALVMKLMSKSILQRENAM